MVIAQKNKWCIFLFPKSQFQRYIPLRGPWVIEFRAKSMKPPAKHLWNDRFRMYFLYFGGFIILLSYHVMFCCRDHQKKYNFFFFLYRSFQKCFSQANIIFLSCHVKVPIVIFKKIQKKHPKSIVSNGLAGGFIEFLHQKLLLFNGDCAKR